MKTYKVGLIGFGFIGKVHAQAYHSIPFGYAKPPVQAQVTAVLRNDPDQDQELLQSLAIPLCTDNEQLFWEQDFDILDVCSPNSSHFSYCWKGIDKKIACYCEKPLTNQIEDARKLAEFSKESKIPTHTAFCYRFRPAIGLAKDILAAGYLGEIHHFQGKFFHSSYLDPNRPISWRLQEAVAGGGALTDLGIHFLDLVRYLLGDCEWLQCQTRTFIKSRPKPANTQLYEEVLVDDWALCTMQLKNGGIGSLEVSRVAGGAGDMTAIEIFGSRGSLKIDFNQPERIQLWDASKNQWIVCGTLPDGIQPVFYDPTIWPAGKRSLGAFMDAHSATILSFLNCLENNAPLTADFETAFRSQQLLHTAYRSAAEGGRKIMLQE